MLAALSSVLLLAVVLVVVSFALAGIAAVGSLLARGFRRGPDERPRARGEVFVLRAPPDGTEEWRVAFRGRVCSPSWRERGPAQAYLDALVRGERAPEYGSSG